MLEIKAKYFYKITAVLRDISHDFFSTPFTSHILKTTTFSKTKRLNELPIGLYLYTISIFKRADIYGMTKNPSVHD